MRILQLTMSLVELVSKLGLQHFVRGHVVVVDVAVVML